MQPTLALFAAAARQSSSAVLKVGKREVAKKVKETAGAAVARAEGAPLGDKPASRRKALSGAAQPAAAAEWSGARDQPPGRAAEIPLAWTAGPVNTVWPPPVEALMHHPELAAALRVQSSAAAGSSAAGPSLDSIRATVLRLGRMVHQQQKRPARQITLNKSTLALCRIAEVRAELKSLGLDSGGQKPEVSKRMLEFVYSLSAEDKATVGLKVDSRGTHALVSFNLSEVPEPPASAAVGEPSDEDVKASVQRLGKLVCDKLPQTHLPSLTKSTLSLVQVADLRSELELLGLDQKGAKPVVLKRLVDFFTARNVVDTLLENDGKSDGRRRGTQVQYIAPEDEQSAFSGARAHDMGYGYGAGGLKVLTGSSRDLKVQTKKQARAAGSAPDAARAEPKPDAVRERKEYYHVLEPQDIVDMLIKAHARNVVLVPVKDRCSWTEAMIIAEGQSLRHLEALAGAVFYQIRERLKKLGSGGQVADGVVPTIEGLKYESPEWLLVDAGNVVVHIFTERARLEYRLEDLWGVESEIVRFGADRKPLETVVLDERPSVLGDIALGQLSRGAGLPSEEVYVHDLLQRERLAARQGIVKDTLREVNSGEFDAERLRQAILKRTMDVERHAAEQYAAISMRTDRLMGMDITHVLHGAQLGGGGGRTVSVGPPA